MIRRTVLVAIWLALFQSAHCGVGSDLEGFFQKLGSVTNSTEGGAHRDQSAGYYNGGGVSVRNRSRNAQLGMLQLPNVNAGCGGIDMFTGGFSFINSAQLVNAMKSIGSSAVSYAFMLAMKTFAPSVQSVMAELQDMASKINQANVNSCEMAATLVGGAWPKSDIASQHVCTSMAGRRGTFTDWVSAKHECGKASQRTSVLGGKDGESDYKDILVEKFNVAWEVLRKNGYLFADKELSYLCMTLSGTIVADGQKVNTYPSKAGDDNLIRALFDGTDVTGYSCDEDTKCLNVKKDKVFRIAAGGFKNKVTKTLKDITTKAIKDDALTPEEIEFIGKVRLPLYKLVNVLTTYKRAEFDLRSFTDIICIDLIHQYIADILDVMLEETANLKSAQVSDEEINKFMRQVQDARTAINVKREVAYRQMNQMLIMIESAKMYEKKLESTFEVLHKNHQEISGER